MTEVVLNVKEVLTPFTRISPASIVIKDERIAKIKSYWMDSPNTINAKELIAVPGFIDTHIHGYRGKDVNSGSVEDLVAMAKELVRRGVTAFIPTTVTLPHDRLLRIAEGVVEAKKIVEESKCGARILGLYLEGPYINKEMKGAQNPEYIREPRVDELEEYYKASKGLLKIVALAPELPGAEDVISRARELGIIVSLGHSAADFDTATKAISLGLSRATHLFNAMKRFHHRDPGAVLALLQAPNVFLEIIADFIHLHPQVVKMVIDFAGWRRVVLITDAISATDLPDGEYELGGLKVIVKNGIARLVDGTLAGSTLTMDRAVKNVASLGIELWKAIAMATAVPAESIGERCIGRIEPGYFADIVLLDQHLDVVKTIVRGEELYSRS